MNETEKAGEIVQKALNTPLTRRGLFQAATSIGLSRLTSSLDQLASHTPIISSSPLQEVALSSSASEIPVVTEANTPQFSPFFEEVSKRVENAPDAFKIDEETDLGPIKRISTTFRLGRTELLTIVNYNDPLGPDLTFSIYAQDSRLLLRSPAHVFEPTIIRPHVVKEIQAALAPYMINPTDAVEDFMQTHAMLWSQDTVNPDIILESLDEAITSGPESNGWSTLQNAFRIHEYNELAASWIQLTLLKNASIPLTLEQEAEIKTRYLTSLSQAGGNKTILPSEFRQVYGLFDHDILLDNLQGINPVKRISGSLYTTLSKGNSLMTMFEKLRKVTDTLTEKPIQTLSEGEIAVFFDNTNQPLPLSSELPDSEEVLTEYLEKNDVRPEGVEPPTLTSEA